MEAYQRWLQKPEVVIPKNKFNPVKSSIMKIKRILNLALAGVILTITASAQTKVKKTKGAKPQETGAESYPWQNYKGPLKQNWFEMRSGLKNSQYIFEETKKGTVAFVGGSIT